MLLFRTLAVYIFLTDRSITFWLIRVFYHELMTAMNNDDNNNNNSNNNNNNNQANINVKSQRFGIIMTPFSRQNE